MNEQITTDAHRSGAPMTGALNQVIALYALGAALAFDDFAWAERAAKDYADASIETLRSAR